MKANDFELYLEPNLLSGWGSIEDWDYEQGRISIEEISEYLFKDLIDRAGISYDN